ncbi:MAG: oxidoreductase [Alphaproteobacteria bacterium]
MAEAYDALLKPFTLKGVTFRNRIMSTSHAPGYAKEGKPQERYQLYHEEKAKGGLGLTMFGGVTTVAIDSPAFEYNQISAADDSVIPYFQQMADRIHGHGAKLAVQLSHIGRKSRWDLEPWLPPIAPSRVREPFHRSHPKAMEGWDIRRVVKAYGQAARRAKEGGLDGFEFQCAFQNLLDCFWSPVANKRTDKYGGSLENRARFSLEVLEEARKQVGPDFIIGIRMSGDEFLEEGMSHGDCLKVAELLARSGMVDFFDVIGGGMFDSWGLSRSMATMPMPIAPYLQLASAFKSELGVTVFHGQRITDIANANRAIADGHVDMVAMTRGHIADPYIAKKLIEGRPEDIRECVGAGYCIDRLFMGGEALCIQNAATSREAKMPHVVPKAPARKKVVVVGAGPGGLEAARVSAERGHDVVLFERDAKTGGQINIAAKGPTRESLSGIVRWLDRQVHKLGVDVRLGTEATGAMVVGEKPDFVVIATGGEPGIGDFGGKELAVSTWDILNGTVQPGERVMVYDDDGRQAASSAAEYLLAKGAAVEIVTPERHASMDTGPLNSPYHLQAFYEKGAILTPDARLTKLYREGNRLIAVLKNTFTNQEEEREIDQVVAEHGTLPREALYESLAPRSANLGEIDLDAFAVGKPSRIVNNPDSRFQLFRVGDAVTSRNIHAAIYDSLRFCKEF